MKTRFLWNLAAPMRALRQLDRRALAAVGLAAMTMAGAQAASIGASVAADAIVGDRVAAPEVVPYPETKGMFKDGVVGLPELTYSYISGYRPLKLDLYLPPPSYATAGPRPLLVYIHGGGWVGGGPRRSAAFVDWPDVLASIASHGYVVASVSYRFAKEAPFPAAIQDVKSAIRWLRVNADKYHIDPNRAMTWGQSAGGQLAGLAAVSCGVASLAPPPRVAPQTDMKAEIQASAPEGFDTASDCVQGAVVWFGVFDFAKLFGPPAPGETPRAPHPYLGCGSAQCSDERLRAPSAVNYIDEKDPPILVIHGAEDKTVPLAQSQQFYNALRAGHVKTELVVIPDVDHSFLGKTQQVTEAATKRALQLTLDFVDATIGDRPK